MTCECALWPAVTSGSVYLKSVAHNHALFRSGYTPASPAVTAALRTARVEVQNHQNVLQSVHYSNPTYRTVPQFWVPSWAARLCSVMESDHVPTPQQLGVFTKIAADPVAQHFVRGASMKALRRLIEAVSP